MDDDYDLAPQAPPPIPQRKPATRAPGAAVGGVGGAGTSAGGRGATSAAAATDYYTVGGVIVVKDSAVLPPRCIKCNAPATGTPMKKRFAYNEDDSGMSAARLIPIIGPIVAMAWLFKRLSTRQYVRVTYSVCGRHRAQRSMGFVILLVCGLAAAGVFVHGMSLMNGAWMAGGLALFVLAIAAGASWTQTLKLTGVRRASVELSGAGPAFRESLPRPGVALRTR